MIGRVLLAAVVAAFGALLAGVASKAIGLHSFWPGVTVSFVFGFALFLTLTRRA